jgi:hypothetical protein
MMFVRCFAYFDEGQDSAMVEINGNIVTMTREAPQIDVEIVNPVAAAAGGDDNPA